MSTIFPGSASVGQVYNNYTFDGTAWNINGIDLTENYLEESSASAIYLAKVSASNTYLTQVSASSTYATKTELNNIDLSSASAAAVAAIVDSAPSTLNTLNELAAALGDDANYASTITTALGNKLNTSTASATYLTQASASSTYANMTTTQISGFRNAIINGGMDIWQRGTNGIVPTSTQPYSADRWESFRSGYAAGMSVYRPSGPTGITYAARVQRDAGNTSTANMIFCQALESINSTRFDGKSATLSFWARAGSNFSAASSILNASIIYGTGNDQNFRSGFTGYTRVSPTAVTLTTSWQRFTVTGNINVIATQVGVEFGYTPVGTAGAEDHFEITGVQLEEGSIATPFEQRPIGMELSLCQRYYQNIVTPNSTTDFNGLMVRESDTQAQASVYLPVSMRITPALIGSYLGRSVFRDTSFNVAAGANSAISVSSSGPNSNWITLIITHASVSGTYVYAEWDLLNTTTNLGLNAEL